MNIAIIFMNTRYYECLGTAPLSAGPPYNCTPRISRYIWFSGEKPR